MENVVAFNNELSGLYETKPPISKAKMAAITKSAMKAIKFYKHVVQSVEKFILKCKPEYKIPGLYVIDSIVRQSRHQYGPEKDVFAPRFARNIQSTFANLFRCASEDKSRIIRVLNLWQKNCVFAPDVIQPLFDLADPNHPIYKLPLPTGSQEMTNSNGNGNQSVQLQDPNTSGMNSSSEENHGLPDLTTNNLTQLLKDPNVLRQLQTLQQFKKQQEEKQIKLNEMRIQEEAFEKHLQNVLKGGSNIQNNDNDKEVELISDDGKIEVINLDGNDSRSPTPERERYKRNRRSRSRSRSRDRGRGGGRRRSRSRTRSRSRSPKSSMRRIGSSRDRNNKGHGDKVPYFVDPSREKDRIDCERRKKDRIDRERRKKGLPDIKDDHLSVCSTTLWVGHLSKLVQQEELSDTFGKYGDIVSIDIIHPRGCAFIVMLRRQDAYKAMNSLKNHKLQGRAITISWAAGKGVKSKEWKDYWDLELGVSYIPWSKISKETELEALEEGGMFDEETMPEWIKDKMKEKKIEHDNLSSTNNEPMFGSVPPNIHPQHNIVDTTQPPPTGGIMPGMVPPFPIGPMGPRMMGPIAMPMLPGGMPNMMPPPHMMLPPGSMMGPPPTGFGSLRPAGSKDHGGPNAPPLSAGPPPFIHMPPGIAHLGIPPHFQQPAQQAAPIQQQPPLQTAPTINVSTTNDEMDIEMEDDLPSNDQNRPVERGSGRNERRDADFRENGRGDINQNEFRNERGRWNRSNDRDNRNNRNDHEKGNLRGDDNWKENNNFSGSSNFGDNRSSVANIPSLVDLANSQQNPFFDRRPEDFNDERRGSRNFFPGGNRFGNRGAQQMPIRNSFGRHGGNNFGRGTGPRPQGGFNDRMNNNFNDRSHFEPEERGGRGVSNNMRERRSRSGWRDEEETGGRHGRFRSRDCDTNSSEDNRRTGDDRRKNSRDRNVRELGSGNKNDNRKSNRTNTISSNDDNKEKPDENIKESVCQDTEEDWDTELKEYNQQDNNKSKCTNESFNVEEAFNKDENNYKHDEEQNQIYIDNPVNEEQDNKTNISVENTPLYDEENDAETVEKNEEIPLNESNSVESTTDG